MTTREPNYHGVTDRGGNEAAAWAELERLARKIDPTLPADLSGKELRITLNKDFQSVECYDLNLSR